MKNIKKLLYKSLSKTGIGRFVSNANFRTRYSAAADYWEQRYQQKGTSGPGSYGAPAVYKAEVLNKFVLKHNIGSILEFGCGDGNQLKLFKFPAYKGLDVSVTAIEKCIGMFKSDATKSFFVYDPNGFADDFETFKADLTLSLDVIYHLLEDKVFDNYMHHLFASSARFVIIYAWDVEMQKHRHIRHRKFTPWIEKNIKDFNLIKKIENKELSGICDFFIYEKISHAR